MVLLMWNCPYQQTHTNQELQDLSDYDASKQQKNPLWK